MKTPTKMRGVLALVGFGVLAACSSDGPTENVTYTVALSPATLALTLGGNSSTASITATVTRKNIVDNTATVTWTTSDANIATVSGTGHSATVTGQGHGSAVITATTNGFSATTAVAVTSPDCLLSSSAPLVTAGTPLNSTLALSDCRFHDAPADFYRLVVPFAQNVTIDMTSTAFGPDLAIYSPTAQLVKRDTPTGGTAHILTVLTAGTYQIGAGARTTAATGAYTLSVTTATVSNCLLAGAVSVTIPQTVSGSLTTTDCVLNSSDLRAADLYKFTLTTGQIVQLTTTSTAFSPVTNLYDVNGNFLGRGDATQGSSRMAWALAPGTYYAVATGATTASFGAYSFSLATASMSSFCSATNAISTITPTTVATNVAGTISVTDCAIPNGTFADIYRVTVTGNANVQFDLASTAFDAYLLLFDPSFNGAIAADNDSGGGKNARITWMLSAGTYYIAANTFDAGETGAYTLTVKIP